SVASYRGLVRRRNQVDSAWNQVDVQRRRRYDLIPNLVETAKGYMKHERETLEAVIQARNQALSAVRQAAQAPDDPSAIQRLMGAEGALSGAMGRLFALMENYPDLKASENMKQLSEELTSTENRVAFARQAYNDAVMQYNTERESVPTNLVASSFHFRPAQLLDIEDPQKRQSPKVSFA
ncbi:MAG: LemA family protein, partial [Nitrospirales bacterium]